MPLNSMTHLSSIIMIKEVKIQKKCCITDLKCGRIWIVSLFCHRLGISKNRIFLSLLQVTYHIGSSEGHTVEGSHAAPRDSIQTIAAVLWMWLTLGPTNKEVFLIVIWEPESSILLESRASRFWPWILIKDLWRELSRGCYTITYTLSM